MSGLADDVRGLTANAGGRDPIKAEVVISRIAEMEAIVRELAAADLVAPRFSSPATRTAMQHLAVRAQALMK